MPGKIGIQESNLTPRDPQQVRSYCEGRQDAKDGTVHGGSPDQWYQAGVASWTADPAGKNTQDACCLPFGGGYVAP